MCLSSHGQTHNTVSQQVFHFQTSWEVNSNKSSTQVQQATNKKKKVSYESDALQGPQVVTLPGASWGGFTAGHKNVWRLDTQSSLTVPIASACNSLICASSWWFRRRRWTQEVAEGQASPRRGCRESLWAPGRSVYGETPTVKSLRLT